MDMSLVVKAKVKKKWYKTTKHVRRQWISNGI